MSTKLDLSEVINVLKGAKSLSPSDLRAVVEELNHLAKPEADEVAPPKPKQQFAIVVSDPAGKVPQGLVGWVVQIPEAASPYSVLDRVNAAAHAFNATKRGRLLPVKSVGEAFESVSRKVLKEAELSVKTKVGVAVLVTDNVLGEPPTA